MTSAKTKMTIVNYAIQMKQLVNSDLFFSETFVTSNTPQQSAQSKV